MFRKGIIAIVVLLFPLFSHGQVSREKKALKNIRNHRYNSAYVLLKKTLAKDTGSVAAKYVLGQYYMRPKNTDYNLDSAYLFTLRSLKSWTLLPVRDRSKLRRLPLDSALITNLKTEIEAKAFEVAQQENTEAAFNHFLVLYGNSTHQGAAVTLRDKLTYEQALQTNTIGAFMDYLNKYPKSAWADEARKKYELLKFEEGTKDKNLLAYSKFLIDNPSSAYKREVERNIFEIMTADGSAAAFTNFINQYPDSYFAGRATGLLHYILPEDPRRDSLSQYDSLDKSQNRFLVPFLQKGKFGLMDPNGKVVVEPTLPDLDSSYICGNIAEDLIAIPGSLIDREGKTVLREDVLSMEDLGYGFLLIELKDGNRIFHRSGFLFTGYYDEAKILQGRFVAARKEKAWELFTLAGRKILPQAVGEVDVIGQVVVLQMNEKFTLSTVSSLAGMVNNQKGKFTEAFDEVKKFSTDKIWIRVDNFEGILDQKLEILVKVDTHQISPAYFGAIAVSAHGQSTFNKFGEESEYFEKIQVVNPWVAVKNSSGWMLYDPIQRISKSISYDSVSIHGPFAAGIKKDGLEIHFHHNPHNLLILPLQDKIEFLPGQDSVSYLLVQKNKKWALYNYKGEKMLTANYERIQSAGNGLFIVSNKEKKGLINAKGKLVLPLEYDAIGTNVDGTISLLKSMKFGLYDHATGQRIKPEYEKNIVRYNKNVLSVFKNGYWGFINSLNKPLSKIEYQEIRQWTDTVALVQMNDVWSLVDIYGNKPVMENIKAFKEIRNTPDERLFIFRQGEDMGVISNVNGIVIPVKFSDIVNVGSVETPVWFTEKHVQEASLFVVIYYNSNGQFLRKEVYEQDDYERIYCNAR